jgi:aspartyl protease family protein
MSAGNGLVIAGVALIGVGMVSSVFKHEAKPVAAANESVASANGMSRPKRISSTDPVTAAAPRELQRGPDGHFYADAQVNGTTVRFMVDTGASVVVLTPEDAQRAGIQLPSERSTAMGVGGPVETIPVTLDRIAVGGIEARGVQAAVVEELPVSLLGQSYLQRVSSVEIRGDRMVLR